MNKLNLTKKQIVSLIILLFILITLPAGVFLAQKQQIFKSQAGGSNSFLYAFELTDSQGNVLKCDYGINPPSCDTSDPNIIIKIKNLDYLIWNK